MLRCSTLTWHLRSQEEKHSSCQRIPGGCLIKIYLIRYICFRRSERTNSILSARLRVGFEGRNSPSLWKATATNISIHGCSFRGRVSVIGASVGTTLCSPHLDSVNFFYLLVPISASIDHDCFEPQRSRALVAAGDNSDRRKLCNSQHVGLDR